MNFEVLFFAIFAGSSQVALSESLKGKTLYTQVNMHSFKDHYVIWVNYGIHKLIPVNTAVEVIYISPRGVSFMIKGSGQKLTLKNKKRHSGLDGSAWAAKHLGEDRVDLSQFTKAEHEAIMAAELKRGMSREAVIIARGYPPAHKTPSLESATWKYWQTNRSRTHVFFNDDGKVVDVINNL